MTALLWILPALAAHPLTTDDPGTVGPGAGEVALSAGLAAADLEAGVAGHVGLADRLDLGATLTWAAPAAPGPALDLKWRVVDRALSVGLRADLAPSEVAGHLLFAWRGLALDLGAAGPSPALSASASAATGHGPVGLGGELGLSTTSAGGRPSAFLGAGAWVSAGAATTLSLGGRLDGGSADGTPRAPLTLLLGVTGRFTPPGSPAA
ncbi:hypothetical protein L6R53_27545 [Myxococcota bacterium]|nr:hypothetical protein [Myxococcota bacterium]